MSVINRQLLIGFQARHQLMLPWLIFEGISSLALTATLLCMMLVEVGDIFNTYMMVALGLSITNVFLCRK